MSERRRPLLGLLIVGLALAGLGRGRTAQAVGRDPALIAAGGLAIVASATADLAPAQIGAFELVADNVGFELWADPATLAFQVVDRRTGYVWNSNLTEVAPEDKLNKTWTAFAQSGVSIDVLDRKAISDRYSITNSEHTLEFKTIDQGFEGVVSFTDVGVALTVRVQLEEDGVQVDLPFDGIQQTNPDFKLGMVHVYPFFGATREAEVPGYMLIPDGTGSLIRFAETTRARNIFYGRYYGADLGMVSELPWDPLVNPASPLRAPIIGMAHSEGENAFVTLIESGAPYAELQAHPAGVITRFNFLYNAFIYNESYFQATNRSGAGVTVLQPATNGFDVRMHYRFLANAEADYVGMARSYQAYLIDQDALHDRIAPSDAIGIHLEFLGGERERVLWWYRFIPMTTVDQIAAILDELDLPNVDVTYYGWQPLGAAAQPPTSMKLDANLGSLDEVAELAADLAQRGSRLNLYIDPQIALRDDTGYSPRNDLAFSITNQNPFGYSRGNPYHYFTVDTIERRFAALNESLAERLPGVGLAVDGMGSVVYSDFRDNRELDRVAAVERFRAAWDDAPVNLAFYGANDYAFSAMDAYYELPLSDNGYLFTSEPVPFLPIVFAGYVPAYGPVLNFSSNMHADLLRHADYGIYPTFFLTHDITARILNTNSSWIYTSSASQWSAEIRDAYAWLDARLGPVRGEPIVARERLARDVFATTYGNGRAIVVNYAATTYRGDGFTVGPEDAVLLEVAP